MNTERSASAIRIACVEARTYLISPRSQSPYMVAGETRSRAAASFTVSSRRHTLVVPMSCITGALTFKRMLARSGESISRGGFKFPSDGEPLLEVADDDSQSNRDWGASGRWFKSSLSDHLKSKSPGFAGESGDRELRFASCSPGYLAKVSGR